MTSNNQTNTNQTGTTQPGEESAGEWRGHSLTRLREITALESSLYGEMRAIQEAMQPRLDEIRARIEAAEADTRTEVARMLDVEDPSVLELGYWECGESPTGHCIYDDNDDISHDYCLICGDPSERK